MKYLKTIKYSLLSQTGRLTMTYLAVIMIMSIAFSYVIYSLNVARLDQRIGPLPGRSYRSEIFVNGSPVLVKDINNFLQRHLESEKSELALQIILLNVLVFIGGVAVSYLLARKSLEPIEEIMSSKDRFISDASHELRTPLTGLLLSNQVALRNSKLSLKEARKVIEDNVIDIKRLQGLANGLLDMMQHRQPLQKSKISYNDAIHSARQNVENMAQDKNIIINNNTSNFSFISDLQILVQILTIILENAVKYSNSNSEIIISAKRLKSQIKISVQDYGVGISKKDISYIFDRFYRSDKSRSSQNTGGHGLGLSIARQQIERLGGSISVKSSSGKGSTFTLSLPQ